MNLRQKLLLLLSLTVAVVVAAVAWTVLVRIRQVFEQHDQQETALFVSQFQREFQHRSADVSAEVDRLASSEHMRGLALEWSQSGDSSRYVIEAQSLAQDAQLDFLEIVGPDGKIVSSAQWPARFGYPEPATNEVAAFLKREEMPDGSTALQWAVYNSDLAKVKQLLKQGADVAAVINYGANAMQLAAEMADPAMLKLLLDAGANADSPNPEGQTALMLVARTGNVEAAQNTDEAMTFLACLLAAAGLVAVLTAVLRRIASSKHNHATHG